MSGGAGMKLEWERDSAAGWIMRVKGVLPRGPADVAGIAAGDEVLGVASQAVLGKTLEQVAALLSGEPGSTVELAVVSRGGAPRNAVVPRQVLGQPPARGPGGKGAARLGAGAAQPPATRPDAGAGTGAGRGSAKDDAGGSAADRGAAMRPVSTSSDASFVHVEGSWDDCFAALAQVPNRSLHSQGLLHSMRRCHPLASCTRRVAARRARRGDAADTVSRARTCTQDDCAGKAAGRLEAAVRAWRSGNDPRGADARSCDARLLRFFATWARDLNASEVHLVPAGGDAGGDTPGLAKAHICGRGARASAAPAALLVVSFAGRSKDAKGGCGERMVVHLHAGASHLPAADFAASPSAMQGEAAAAEGGSGARASACTGVRKGASADDTGVNRFSYVCVFIDMQMHARTLPRARAHTHTHTHMHRARRHKPI